MKIYKYASIESALKILEDRRLLLRNPLVFNDPFDSNAKRSKKDITKVRKIMTSFTSATLLVQLSMDPNIAPKVQRNPLFLTVCKEYQTLVNALKIYPRFDGNFGFRTLYKLLGLKSSAFKELADKNIEKFELMVTDSIEHTKKDALATCFSKVHDSILMWSHYADSHAGVCIEYERPNTKEFVDVVYKKKRPQLELAELISFTSATAIIGQDYNHQLDDALSMKTIRPFYTKSIDWKYEQEVRCLTTTSAKSTNVVLDNGSYYFKMPKPSKIYIGCRAKGREMNKLIALAKKQKIKIVFLKDDDNEFALTEK